MPSSPETWKPIPGFDGYEASNFGRIRSLDRVVIQVSRNGNAYRRLIKGKLLKVNQHRDGHLQLNLGRVHGNRFAHKLVLLAFKGPPPPGHESCHNDNDPANNHLSNLRYDTRSNNLADRRR